MMVELHAGSLQHIIENVVSDNLRSILVWANASPLSQTACRNARTRATVQIA